MERTHLDITKQKRLEAEYSNFKSDPDFLNSYEPKDNNILPTANRQLLAAFLKYCPAMVAMVDKEMKYLVVTDSWKSQFWNGITGY